MKKITCLILSALLAALLLCSCGADRDRVSPEDNMINGVDGSALSDGTNYKYGEADAVTPTSYAAFEKSALNFSFELLKNAYGNGIKNVAPANAYMGMGLLANGNTKDAKNEILAALGGELTLDNMNKCVQYFQTRLSCFNDNSTENNYYVKLKNSLWCNDTFDIKKDFLKTDSFYYNTEVYRFLFSDSETLTKLNNWVTDNSQNETAALEMLDEKDSMHLAGAVSISDNWLEDYAEVNISKGAFNGADSSGQAVYCASSEFYIKSENARGFIKSFKNTPLKLCVLVPEEELTTEDFLKTLTGDAFSAMLNNMDPTVRCNAYLPGFSVSEASDISPALKAMGINTVFTEDAKADNMSQTEGVHLSSVCASVKFEISENGVSSDLIHDKTASNTKLDNEITVKADRPFVYAVIDNESNIPLYLGIVENI